MAHLLSLINNQQKEIDSLKFSKRELQKDNQNLREEFKRFKEISFEEQQRQIRNLQLSLNRIEEKISFDEKRKCNWKDTPCIKKISSSPHPHTHQTQQQLITFYGSIITLNVEPDDSIESLKHQIAHREDIEVKSLDQLLLFYAGQQLEDDKTLSFYDIHSNNDRKHLVLRLRDGMKIFVKTIEDKTIQVKVDPNDTIELIKVKIHEQEGISPCDQRLILNGIDLPDLQTIADHGIKHNTTLQLDLHLGGPCPICQTQFKNSLASTSS